MRLGVLASHPIQYQAPLFRSLALHFDLAVYFAHRQTAEGQAQAGYGVTFDWDIDLLSGYSSQFLNNRANHPNVFSFGGCDTPEISEIIRAGKFDAFIVTGWYLKCYWQAIRACRRYGVPVLVRGDSQLGTQRSWLKRAGKKILYRWIMRQFDGFLYVGQRNLEYLRHYGARLDRCFFSPHFVDNEWFRSMSAMTPEQRNELRQLMRAQPGEFILLSVGRLVEMKRPFDLLKAARILKDQGGRIRLVYVGAGSLESEIQQQARSLDVQVTMTGFKNQTELPRNYAVADLLILSSSSETWGLVVNEAMACGIPAVVSDAAGCVPDLIDEGVTGSSYPVGDVKALAVAIQKMLVRCGTDETKRALTARLERYSVQQATSGILSALETIYSGAGCT